MKKYKNWRLLKETDQELVFRTSIDDISPILKENGYVGLSVNGILSALKANQLRRSTLYNRFFKLTSKGLRAISMNN